MIGDPKPTPTHPSERVTNGRAVDELLNETGLIEDDGCRTWIVPPVGYNLQITKQDVDVGDILTPPNVDILFNFEFEEFNIYGHAHLAISTVPLHEGGTAGQDKDAIATLDNSDNSAHREISIYFAYMLGDR